MKGVILAAGMGTRMLPLTQRRPKPLVPVVDRPMIEHIILGAGDAGVDHIALIIGHLGDMIREHLGDGARLGLKLDYIEQGEPKGTGHATMLARDFIGGEAFFMGWGDIIVPAVNYRHVVSAYAPGQTAGVLGLNWVEDPCEGAAVYVEDGRVVRIQEKPPRGTATTHYNNAGLFVWGPEFFDYLAQVKLSPRGEIELPDAVQQMIAQDRYIRGVPLEGYWSDVARPGAVLALNEMMMRGRFADHQGLYVDPSAQVSPRAELVAPLYIGPGCRVAAAHLGPNVALTEGCLVEEGAHLEEAAVFTGARVGGRARGYHCLIEEGAMVEAGRQIEGTPGAPCVQRSDGQVEKVPQPA